MIDASDRQGDIVMHKRLYRSTAACRAALCALAWQALVPGAAAGQQPAPAGDVRLIEHQPIVMRDGVDLDATIELPAGAGPFPVILVRTPYPITPVSQSHDGFMSKLLARGYAIVNEYERGMYWSEGQHSYMARAKTDGYDTIDWIVKQPWSSGKVGTYGCSSTAENQLGLIASNHPAHRAAIVLGYGAGIGRIGPYAEQGNLYRGGALQLLFSSWNRYYIGADGPGANERPIVPHGLSQEERARIGRVYSFGLKDFAGERTLPPGDLARFYAHLPSGDIIKAGGGVRSGWDVFARRLPGDPAWAKTDFVNEGDRFGVPTIWGVSWYDVSVGSNLYLYDYAKKHLAPGRAADQQWLIAAPVTHCAFQRTTATGTVGDLDVGDATYDYDKRFIDFFDWKLKGIANGAADEPRVMAYQLGENRWTRGSDFPVVADHPMTLYLASGKGAKSAFGDGALVTAPPAGMGPMANESDSFTYDPRRPVQTIGGGLCCLGAATPAGAFDQANVEARADVLVYSTPPLDHAVAIRGPISVDLYVGSTARETDFTVKLVDVHPDGKAYNLEDGVFRVRYRDGYDRVAAPMEAGKVYRIAIPPLFTANTFLPGHRIRLDISSSNFPLYDRNLNTGGKNSEESAPTTAVNRVLHSARYPSMVRMNLYRLD